MQSLSHQVMSSSHESHENSPKDGKPAKTSYSHKSHPKCRCFVPDQKTVRKPEPKASTVRKIVYDPARFLREMDEGTRRKFEKLYPRRLYDDTTRHRIIVSGELSRDDFRGFDSPREGIFFLDEQGSRKIYGRDIQAYKDKTAHVGTYFDMDGREHLLLERNRTAADRSMQYSYVSRHRSEKEWNVARDNEHHFLKFPAEIRTQILEYILLARVPIIPKTVVCTWRTSVAEPGYLLEGYVEQLRESIIKLPREDDHGTYTEIRRIYRKPIDASCLRVNKQFHSEGAAILYGHNTFCCTFIPSCVKEKGRLRTLGDSGNPIIRSATKPGMEDIGNPTFMLVVRDLMEGRETDDNLEGWIFCDPVLRFIRTIGPSNAARLRSLYLEGRSIKYDLRCYGPFLERYCHGIRKMTIGPVWTYSYQLSQSETARALLESLRYGLARFPSLKELVLIDKNEQLVPGADELMNEICRSQERYAATQQKRPPNKKSLVPNENRGFPH